jgi:hypothetical protein
MKEKLRLEVETPAVLLTVKFMLDGQCLQKTVPVEFHSNDGALTYQAKVFAGPAFFLGGPCQ